MSGLVVSDLRVVYGGRVAVDGVSLLAGRGRITGLIGPNGAGKTSLLQAVAGTVPLTSGRIVLDGVDLTSLAPWRRAQAGLRRTFQRTATFTSLPVRDDVGLGIEGAVAGARAWRHLGDRRASRDERAAAVGERLTTLGISPLADRPVASLDHGQRRLVEVARALVGSPAFVLLDEPAAGLDDRERQTLVAAVRSAAADGVGFLLVEHDLPLVVELCEQVVVLDTGRVVYDGPAGALADDPAVRAAYVGGT